MVSSEEGRFELARRGLNPYLVRLCVGEEPADVVVQVVQDALAAARAASAKEALLLG
jgi:cystathionine beta-lyase/cystathionine gamma-synthase